MKPDFLPGLFANPSDETFGKQVPKNKTEQDFLTERNENVPVHALISTLITPGSYKIKFFS